MVALSTVLPLHRFEKRYPKRLAKSNDTDAANVKRATKAINKAEKCVKREK